MNNIRKRLRNKMGARAKVRFILALVFILLFSIGCNSGDDSQVVEEAEIVQEEVVEEEETQEEEGTEEIVEVEVVPVERKTTLTGGMEVLTPDGLTFSGFEAIETGDKSHTYVKLDGLELKKTYEVNITGTTASNSIIQLYLLDGSEFTSVEELDLASVTVIDVYEIQVLGDYDERFMLTNSFETISNGVLYITSTDTEGYVKELSIRRHIGALKFSDEFDYEGLPNEDWTYELGGNGWGNGELQYYNGDDLDNASVSNGELTITAMEEKKDNNDYTSARMRTVDSFTYGRYEISAKLPYGRGTWPAIWMLPAGNNYGNWPNSGEIDIMEHVGYEMDVVHGSLHMSEFNFRKNNHPTAIMNIPEVDTMYHTYTMEWSPYQIDMYIDNYHYMSFKNDGQGPKHWPYDEQFYLLLNIAVGGAWGGQQGIDSIFPQTMVIDYVRIYDLEDEVVDTLAPDKLEVVTIETQGTTVFFEFDPVEDNYKVDYYEVTVANDNSATISIINGTSGFVYGLDENSNYKVQLVAVDEVGNRSEAYETTVETTSTTLNNVNEWAMPSDTYFVSGASISEGEEDNFIAGFEAEDLMAYRFNVEVDGTYQLELEISGKLFDGEVLLLNENQEELTAFVATKTGDKEVYEVVITEEFNLLAGQQTLFLETLTNGYQIKNVRLINGE